VTFNFSMPGLKNTLPEGSETWDEQQWKDWWEATMSPEQAADYWSDEAVEAASGTLEPIYDDTGRTTGLMDPTTGETVKDYGSLWEQLDVAKETGIPSLDEWMTQQGYEYTSPLDSETMTQMQDLVTQLTTGPTAMELSDAQAYAAQIMGIDPADYQSIVGGLLGRATGELGALEGIPEEERALRERANRIELRGMEERASRMINNLQAATGSTSRAYAAADQAIRQINDAQLQQSLALAQDDYTRRVNQQETAERQWAQMVQAGQMGQAQYLNLLQQSKSMAFQGYALEINTMMQQNQQYLQQYQADAMAIEANINNIYKAIQMEIGIDEKAINDIQRAYDMEMRPILDQMNIALMEIERAEAEDAAAWGQVFDFITLGVSIITAPMTGGTSLLGWGLGQLASSGAGTPQGAGTTGSEMGY
jgi:hypothetical protein